jgi:hypothetical protein
MRRNDHSRSEIRSLPKKNIRAAPLGGGGIVVVDPDSGSLPIILVNRLLYILYTSTVNRLSLLGDVP